MDKLKFELGKNVRILNHETAQVVARAENLHSEPMYLLRYVGAHGSQEQWWGESALAEA